MIVESRARDTKVLTTLALCFSKRSDNAGQVSFRPRSTRTYQSPRVVK